MKKFVAILFAVLMSFSVLPLLVVAQEEAPEDFEIVQIEVDGVEVFRQESGGTETQTIHVERGTDIEIRVEFKSNIDSDRVGVKAWIGGFEFGDVEDRTGIFTVEPEIIYSKFLNLEVPNDIELDEEEFKLHIEVFDNAGSSELTKSFNLAIRKERHDLNIIDALFFPSNTVEAGRALRTVVRVENLGEKKEEDVLVKVSIPELGISTKNFIDELVSDEEETDDDSEETSESSDELVLFIPENTPSGEYLVEIEVEFNRGHDVITEKKTILVEGKETTIVSKAIISVDMSSQNIEQGQEVPYKFMIANLGNQRTLYSVEVEGASGWGTTKVSPAFVSVDQGDAGEVFVFVKANENAAEGIKTFKADILADGVKVKEVNLNANVVAKEKEVVTTTGFQNTQRALEIAFVILVVILVILGLVIAFRRVGTRTRESSEPETIEGQTYY